MREGEESKQSVGWWEKEHGVLLLGLRVGMPTRLLSSPGSENFLSPSGCRLSNAFPRYLLQKQAVRDFREDRIQKRQNPRALEIRNGHGVQRFETTTSLLLTRLPNTTLQRQGEFCDAMLKTHDRACKLDSRNKTMDNRGDEVSLYHIAYVPARM